MYFISNTDGIPVLTDNPNDEEITREATDTEVRIFNDFWKVYLDLVEEGYAEDSELDSYVREFILTAYGLTDMI